MATSPDGRPVMDFAHQEEWRGWLDAHHADSGGVWIRIAKRASGIASVDHDQAVEVALCFGWIDGQVRRVDDDWFMQRFTPRTKRSKWSRLMREKAEELIASEAMRPAGLAEVERARADGRWDVAYEPPSTATVPADLQEALDASPAAAEFFAGLDANNRYAILHRIHDAKRPETRARRIEKFTAMLARGEKIHS
jgi:uncharacterized protein YdeI (YjbR/CyaY-like superfamily)